MEIREIGIDEVIPYEGNPRINDQAVDAVANSIREFGFRNPILVDENNVIIAGHTRYKAAKKLGMTTIPTIQVTDPTEEQVNAFRVVDNKTGELSEWDFDKLEIELSKITGIDMEMFGFDIDEIPGNEKVELEEDGYEPDVPEKPMTKPGEIFQLGRHRLMCGSSTNPEDVKKLMHGKVADLIETDPPYNVDISNSAGDTIKNDSMSEEEFRKFLTSALRCGADALKPGGAFYIWYSDSSAISFRQACEENGLDVKQTLIWVKNHHTLTRSDYKWKHEPCLYGWKKGASHYFVQEYNHPTVIEDTVDIDRMKKAELKKMLSDILFDAPPVTVMRADKPLVDNLHPTMKPVKLIGEQIRNSTLPDQIVLDLFGGSGTTMIACEQLGRSCYMMELDPKYCDVIIKRYEDFTGMKADRIGSAQR